MMTVCGNCHTLCTANAYSIEEQRAAKYQPKNITDDFTRGQLFTNNNDLIVHLAGGTAINTPSLLAVGDTDVVKVEKAPDGRLLVSALVQNEDGQTIAHLHENEWSASHTEVWDFEAYPKRTIVRTAPRKISFEVDARNDEIELKGTWFLQGQKIDFTPTKCLVGNMQIVGFRTENCSRFLQIN